MIACYLTLHGQEGMPLVEELFLKDADIEYSDTYAAIMALRFHGTESDVIPRARITGVIDALAAVRAAEADMEQAVRDGLEMPEFARALLASDRVKTVE